MGYITLRAMKVQKADGSVELRAKGQPVPEAENWPNPGVWVKRGYIAVTDAETANKSGYTRDKLIPARPSTEADKKRAEAHVPMPGKPLPGHDTDVDGDGDIDADDTDVDGDGDIDADDTKAELLKMNRDDLNSFAEENGVEDPDKLPNKEAVAEAVIAAADE